MRLRGMGRSQHSPAAGGEAGRHVRGVAHRGSGTHNHPSGEDLLRRDVKEESHETDGDAVEPVHDQDGAARHAEQHPVGLQPLEPLAGLVEAARRRRG
jgi:hypothetical protein